MNHKTYQGDTSIPNVVMAGVDAANQPVDVLEDGWVCYAQVLDNKRNALTHLRQITDTIDINGVLHFVAAIRPTESVKMSVYPDRLVRRRNYWSVVISNQALGYRHTVEVELDVLPKP